jgi:hypothetical protein
MIPAGYVRKNRIAVITKSLLSIIESILLDSFKRCRFKKEVLNIGLQYKENSTSFNSKNISNHFCNFLYSHYGARRIDSYSMAL